MNAEKREDGKLRRTADDIFPKLHEAKVFKLPVYLYDAGQPVK